MAKGLCRRFTALVASLGLGLALGPMTPQALGQEMPQITRQNLVEPFITTDIPKEAVVNVYLVTLPPGAETGWHSHDGSKPGPGPAIAYILEGTVTLEERQPDGGITTRTLGPGSVNWESGITHNAKNLGKTPVKVFVVRMDMPRK